MGFGPSAGPPQAGPRWQCLAVNPPNIAVPLGDRPDSPAFSGARLGKGLIFTSMRFDRAGHDAGRLELRHQGLGQRVADDDLLHLALAGLRHCRITQGR